MFCGPFTCRMLAQEARGWLAVRFFVHVFDTLPSTRCCILTFKQILPRFLWSTAKRFRKHTEPFGNNAPKTSAGKAATERKRLQHPCTGSSTSPDSLASSRQPFQCTRPRRARIAEADAPRNPRLPPRVVGRRHERRKNPGGAKTPPVRKRNVRPDRPCFHYAACGLCLPVAIRAGCCGVLQSALPDSRLVSTPSREPSRAWLGVLRAFRSARHSPNSSRFRVAPQIP